MVRAKPPLGPPLRHFSIEISRAGLSDTPWLVINATKLEYADRYWRMFLPWGGSYTRPRTTVIDIIELSLCDSMHLTINCAVQSLSTP